MTPDLSPPTPREAVALQRELRSRLVMHPPPEFRPRLVAGADVSMEKRGDRAWGGIVVIDIETMETVEEASAEVALGFPYIPGLLSFRELPVLAAAWARLRQRPDVVIFDGAGYAHPRRFGLACHGGVMFGVPSVGCAKTRLVGTCDEPGRARGSRAPLLHRGEVVGTVLRTRDGVSPLFVSQGDQMDLDTAAALVLALAVKYREPETTRRAHALVNRLRRESGR
ncbi:MAG TPA: endonuclease V [Gemmatimonadaceae bacterium]|nr:endonuclease V [Gemmatimonadaceae bacterium]